MQACEQNHGSQKIATLLQSANPTKLSEKLFAVGSKYWWERKH